MANEEEIKRGTVLQVPYKEKDEAKKLGARWDPDIRCWFVPAGMNVEPFRRWRIKESEGAKSDNRR